MSIDDAEAAVKVVLNFIGSDSSHCNALRSTTVLEEYIHTVLPNPRF